MTYNLYILIVWAQLQQQKRVLIHYQVQEQINAIYSNYSIRTLKMVWSSKFWTLKVHQIDAFTFKCTDYTVYPMVSHILTLGNTAQPLPSLILPMSTWPWFICRVAWSAGSSCRRSAGSWSRVEVEACRAGDTGTVEDEEELDVLEGFMDKGWE